MDGKHLSSWLGPRIFCHQDGCQFCGVFGNDVIRIRMEEGSVFAAGMDGESIGVWEAWRSLSVIRRDVQFVSSVGNDVIKIRMEEGSVFAVRMDG